ncbi:flagellar biosynthesis protein FlgB [Bombella sp. TMW 2.2543]|uniref:Flagellar biosynthesis protein FlgB n=1 Tax=Bombella pluederhausensis TaxID=2967336 RepID=A0ABT3WGA3_9PROT|nr:flagellar basal body protein [Bombella pluederhausensis]MCX5618112.1 flagellar biosynthesis protein FlgB [Bombella pluederhausensis]
MSMTQTGGTDLLNLAERRMSWLQNRESVLAGNVANANTPHYSPKDVSPFQGVLNAAHGVALKRTNPAHMLGPAGETHAHKQGGRASLDGNRVVLEDELGKIAQTSDQQRFATTVYGRYMGLYGMALGGGGQ